MSDFDFIVMSALIIFLLRGWHIGFLRSLAGPFIFLAWSIIGILYYDTTVNLIGSILVTIAGTIITTFIISIFWLWGKQTVHKEHRNYVFWGSRLLGGVVSLSWQGMILAVIIYLFSSLPVQALNLTAAREAVRKSRTHALIEQHLADLFPQVRHVSATISILSNPQQTKSIVGEHQYQRIVQDPQIKNVLQDPDIRRNIENRNILELVTNQRIKTMLRDEKLMEKVSKISREIYRRQQTDQ
ncbi:MAG: hypothetical protein ACLFPX_07915 [Candidatus Omnitrophota bacterium]